jgi:hypothetical protein
MTTDVGNDTTVEAGGTLTPDATVSMTAGRNLIAAMKILVFSLVVGIFVMVGFLVVTHSRTLLRAEQKLQDSPKEPTELKWETPKNATVAEQLQIADKRTAAYKAYYDAVKAVAETNAKQGPLAVYTAVIKDVLLGILTTMLAAFITYAFSIVATDIGHNIALGKGADKADLKHFTLFG